MPAHGRRRCRRCRLPLSAVPFDASAPPPPPSLPVPAVPFDKAVASLTYRLASKHSAFSSSRNPHSRAQAAQSPQLPSPPHNRPPSHPSCRELLEVTWLLPSWRTCA